jgi:pyridoxine 5-phosphate synthase
MTALSVNLNKIALLRNSREGDYPSVLQFAQLAVEAGANGLTVHPRPDQRHIRVDDIMILREYVRKLESIEQKTMEFNIEGNPFAEPMSTPGHSDYPGLMSLIDVARPHQATLVPDSNDQLTSDHGFNLHKDGKRLQPILQQLKQWQVRISLFMDADLEQIKLAKDLGADRIELYTGPYALMCKSDLLSVARAETVTECLARYSEAVDFAHSIGLGVNAGHDLNLDNLPAFLAIGHIDEVSIGHALTVDALLSGYKNTILDYSRCCDNNSSR